MPAPEARHVFLSWQMYVLLQRSVHRMPFMPFSCSGTRSAPSRGSRARRRVCGCSAGSLACGAGSRFASGRSLVLLHQPAGHGWSCFFHFTGFSWISRMGRGRGARPAVGSQPQRLRFCKSHRRLEAFSVWVFGVLFFLLFFFFLRFKHGFLS